MQITKLKHRGGVTEVSWIEGSADGTSTTTHAIESKMAPDAGLPKALAGLGTQIAPLCDMPPKDVLVTGLTWKRDKKDGVVVTAQRTLDGIPSPLCFNTPYLSLKVEAFEKLAKACAAVEREGLKYLEGHRAQMDLLEDGS